MPEVKQEYLKSQRVLAGTPIDVNYPKSLNLSQKLTFGIHQDKAVMFLPNKEVLQVDVKTDRVVVNVRPNGDIKIFVIDKSQDSLAKDRIATLITISKEGRVHIAEPAKFGLAEFDSPK